jgi:hypothetical protein
VKSNVPRVVGTAESGRAFGPGRHCA